MEIMTSNLDTKTMTSILNDRVALRAENRREALSIFLFFQAAQNKCRIILFRLPLFFQTVQSQSRFLLDFGIGFDIAAMCR